MSTKRTISLRDVRDHVKSLDRLVTDAWFDKSDGPTQISYADLRKHASGILDIVGTDDDPHAATATKSPAAATDTDKSTARERAAYASAAADKALSPDIREALGVGHIRRS